MKNCLWFVFLHLCLPMLVIAQSDTLWTHWYGGGQTDNGYAVRETPDGGYAIAGETRSYGAGGSDFWLIRTDSTGDTLWTRTYGGTQDETCFALEVTADSGFILVGRSNSFGGGWSGYAVRTNSAGDTVWTRKYGGAQRDEFAAVLATPDSGFVIGGYTLSYGAGGDFWLLKIAANGDSLWSHTYGGSRNDYCYALVAASDSGFLLAGSTESFGNGLSSTPDYWLVKVSAAGDSLWSRSYGGTSSDVCTSIAPLGDGYALGGYTQSYGAGNADFWVIKISSSGDSLTCRTFGTSRQDFCESVRQTSDGELIIAGDVDSGAMGGSNFWLIRANANLDTSWNCIFGGTSVEHCRAAIQTRRGTYLLAGSSYSYGIGIPNVWAVESRAPVQSIETVPDSLNFGNVLVGSHRDTLVLIRNNGTYTTHLMEVIAPRGFSTNYPGGDIPLDPLHEYLVSVRFQPDSARVYNDTVQVYTSGPASPYFIFVHGVAGGDFSGDRASKLAPRAYALSTYPNPFNPMTTLSFDVPKTSRVRLAIYDVNGRLVETVADGVFAVGRHRLTVDGSRLSNGVYFVRMNGQAVSMTKKLVLMK